MLDKKSAQLVLQDGRRFAGYSFGAARNVPGEVVFSTAMTGYTESFTDPSFAGQILVMTYPLVGNYGVPSDEAVEGILRFFESNRMHIRALVITDYCFEPSHWNAVKTLDAWMKEQNVPGIYGVDTRAITKILREEGVMQGKVEVEGDATQVNFEDPNQTNLVAGVSCTEPITYGNGKHRIVLVDCGCKNNIIRCLLQRDTTVVRVPWNYDFTKEDYDGVMISNGPGNPMMCPETISNIKKAIQVGKPIFGICLGNQLLSIAAGAKTFKLKYGHRSHNQPVLMSGTTFAVISSQNHGFAADLSTLDKGWEPYFTNLNDGTSEGIIHKEKPFFSVQFHPEASSGPTDSDFLFDKFIENVKQCKQ